MTLGNVVDLQIVAWSLQHYTASNRKAVSNYVNYKLHGTLIIMERFSKSLKTY